VEFLANKNWCLIRLSALAEESIPYIF